MFKINEYIMYGTTGVCQVIDINTQSFGDNGKKEYYVLSPVYSKNTVIKIPVDNIKIKMRRIISKEEVSLLIKNMSKKDLFWIDDERKRNEEFKSLLRTGECEDLITLIQSITQNKKDKQSIGKKVSKGDEEIMQTAERLLNQEFATILNITPEEVSTYISEHIAQ